MNTASGKGVPITAYKGVCRGCNTLALCQQACDVFSECRSIEFTYPYYSICNLYSNVNYKSGWDRVYDKSANDPTPIPVSTPSFVPSVKPSTIPPTSLRPTATPTLKLSAPPTRKPTTMRPTKKTAVPPTLSPTVKLTAKPSAKLSPGPTLKPTSRSSTERMTPSSTLRPSTLKPTTSRSSPVIYSSPQTQSFSGSNYLRINNDAVASSSWNHFTFAAWVKSSKGSCALVSLGRTPSNYDGEFEIYLENRKLSFYDYSYATDYGFQGSGTITVARGTYQKKNTHTYR